MGRFLAGVAAALLLTTAGLLWWNGRAADRHLPGAPPAAGSPALYGKASAGDPPAASDESREQRRFGRYDKDQDGKVSRDEYLAARRKAFAKLDANHDGRLDFDEWAAKAIGRFTGADQGSFGHARSEGVRCDGDQTQNERAGALRRCGTARGRLIRRPRGSDRCGHARSSAPCVQPCAHWSAMAGTSRS